jgi:type I restriction enzyme S subunit
VDSRYLLWLFTHYYRNGIFASVAGGVGINHLSAAKFARLLVPIAPDDEQHHIVAEIEKQFTRLDAGVAALRRVQANLKRYRASVLKAACEGRLVPTEAELARQSGRPYETGADLLARILTERRTKWSGRGKYEEPTAIGSVDTQIPEGWAMARLEQLGQTFGGLTKNPKRAKFPKQLPYLRVANVYSNELRLEEIEWIGVDDSELSKLLLQAGDLLIVEGNGSKDQIGRLAVWDGSIDPCVHQNHLIKFRPALPALSKWILNWLQSPDGRRIVEEVASSTSGLYTLSVGKVGALRIALPPATEQLRIVAEVDRRLSVLDELEALVSANLQRATRLRQSILQRAFAGELVHAE